ncbi:hypothetical protein BTW32_30805 [Bacillus thuringiensis]|nr:hypothetical protein BTW32_30805 [Bacillus thuringiensis]
MGNRIKKIRKQQGDTLKSLAQKINYDYSNLSKIERGVYVPSIPILRRISEVYGVGLQYLIGCETGEYLKRTERKLVYNLDIDKLDSLETYILTIDDQQLTKEEIEFTIDVIRTLRQSVTNIKNITKTVIEEK